MTRIHGLLLLAATVSAAAPRLARAQSAPADPKFDALVSLTEAKMKEYGVPGVALGILQNGVTTLMYEGAPTCPGPDRFWKIIDDHKVTVF